MPMFWLALLCLPTPHDSVTSWAVTVPGHVALLRGPALPQESVCCILHIPKLSGHTSAGRMSQIPLHSFIRSHRRQFPTTPMSIPNWCGMKFLWSYEIREYSPQNVHVSKGYLDHLPASASEHSIPRWGEPKHAWIWSSFQRPSPWNTLWKWCLGAFCELVLGSWRPPSLPMSLFYSHLQTFPPSLFETHAAMSLKSLSTHERVLWDSSSSRPCEPPLTLTFTA